MGMAASSDRSFLQLNLNYCCTLRNVKSGNLQLGMGAYGRVFEVEYAGMKYAAKELHSIFFELENAENLQRIKEAFLRECRIWSTLRHPKIVSLIGVYYRDGDSTDMPVMVMEKMECNLRSLIEKQGNSVINSHIKLSILHDVSLGLWHLHNQDPPIIHRDLTPNNILVRRGVHCYDAKISDLGVSKVMPKKGSSCKMTIIPGTPDFMPPETFFDDPQYDKAVDVFSYGGIVLCTIGQQWPTPKAKLQANNKILSETERRQEYVDKINIFEDELKPLVKACLEDESKDRPEISTVSDKIAKLKMATGTCEEFDSILVTPQKSCSQSSEFSLCLEDEPKDRPEISTVTAEIPVTPQKSCSQSSEVSLCLEDEPKDHPETSTASAKIAKLKIATGTCEEFDSVPVTPPKSCSQSSEESEKDSGSKTKDVKQLKLTMRDALLIRSNLPKEFNLQKVKPEILPYVTLNKIMTCEYRNGTCCYDTQSMKWCYGSDDEGDTEDDSNEDDNNEDGSNEDDNNEEDNDGDDNDGENNDGEDNDGEDNDGENNDREDNDGEDDDNIHPVDNLLNLIHCSDNILRQTIMEKLSLCQVALPLLLPNHSDNTVSLLLWAMRSTVKKWCVLLSNKYVESPIVDYYSPVVSFLRIGSVNLSKSMIINHVIGEFEFFFYHGCNRVNCNKRFTEGLVDLCCYLPGSSTDQFPLSNDLLLFLNLHGDALKCEKQVNLIQQLSAVSIVFVSESNMDDNTTQMIKNLAKSNKTVLVFDNISKQKPRFSNKIVCLNIQESTTKLVENQIQAIITKTVKSTKKKMKLSNCTGIAKDCGILVDEYDNDCTEGYKEAKYILDELKKCNPTETKLKFFPLQGAEGWKKWAEIDRKQCEEFGKLNKDLEKFNIIKNAQKLDIRRKMEHHCNDLSSPVEKFMEVLSKSTNSNNINYIYKHYFLRWLKLLLDMRNRSVLVDLTSNNECSTNESCNAMIGLEHFFREISQFYETLRVFQKHSDYPRIMAELMSDGYCMEVMDGDSTHVPVEWASAVFKELQAMYNSSTMCAVSIVGVQSTGKSTLLNTMFGLNFDVSAGRCTRGAFMQLLCFHEDARKTSKCDYLLLIDTEGLRAPELQFIGEQHDNELAAFVIGLADVAIINIGGESQTELSDILQTVCHGLIRIKNIEINPSCKFVHHQITDPGAEGKTRGGREAFLQLLKENVRKVCELDLCNESKSFTEVMNCSEEQDILNFKPLWHGNPPMAKVNIQYVENTQNLKLSLINGVGLHTAHSFTSFSFKLNTIWNAVLCEQFLFSFKNALEVIIRKEYDQEHCKWNSELRLDFLEWQCQAKVSFRKDESQHVKTREQRMLNEVQIILEKRKKKILEKRDEYFKKSKHRTILAEWGTKSNDKINNYCEEYMEWAKRSIKELIIEYNSEREVNNMMKNIYMRLKDFAHDLFVSSPNIRLSDRTLEEKFNEKWSLWLDSIPSVKYRSSEEIEHQILKILVDYVKFDEKALNHKLLKTPLTNWSTAFTLNVESHLTIKYVSEAQPTDTEIFEFVEYLVSDWIKKFVHRVESIETQIQDVYSYEGILHQFHHQLSKLIKEFEDAKQKYDFFQFTKECVLDSVLIVSKKTKDLLTSFEEKARTSDVKHDLENREKGYLKFLIVAYDDKKKKLEEKTATMKRLQVEEEREKEQKEYEESLERDNRETLEQNQTFEGQQDTAQLTEREKEGCKRHEQENNKVPLEADRLLDTHTKVVEYLCDIIENAVTKALKDSVKFRIYKDMIASNTFQNKENFKLSVLKLLLEKDNFEAYKLYFTDPEKSFEENMHCFINKHCNYIDPLTNCTKFRMVTESILQELFEPIQAAITATNIDSNNLTFCFWITKFSTNVHSKTKNISLSNHDIQSISKTNIPWKSSEDANAFKRLFLQQVNPTLVKMNSQKLYNDIKAELAEYMWKNLKKPLLGCTACCPFCKEMCDGEEDCGEDEKHSVKLHRPQCFSKLLQHQTRCLVVDVCTTAVGSDSKFRNSHTSWKWKPYKQYQSFYPNWFIESMKKPVEPYWIWVVTHFKKDIAAWCGKGKTDSIPEEWRETTKIAAEKCFNLPN